MRLHKRMLTYRGEGGGGRNPPPVRTKRMAKLLPVLFLLSCLAGAGFSGEQEKLSAAFSRFDEEASSPASPWPGYSPLRYPLVVEYPKWGHSLLFTRDHSAAEGDKLTVRVSSARYSGPDFDEIFPDGRRTFRVRFVEGMEKGFRLAVHEGFHVFQGEKFSAPADLEMPARIAPSTLAAARVERQLLYRALSSADWRAAAARFAAFRRARYSGEDAGVRRFEELRETLEGTARYVEWKALRYLENRGDNDNSSDLPVDLADFFNVRLPYFMYAPYGAGLAQCLLLDRLGINWKTAVQDGASLFEVLAAGFPAEKTRDASEAAKIKVQYGFAKLLSVAAEEVSAYERGLAQLVREHERPRDGVRVHVRGFRSTANFSLRGGIHYLGGTRVFIPSLRQLAMTEPGRMELALTGGSAILSLRQDGNKADEVDFVAKDPEKMVALADGEKFSRDRECSSFSESFKLTGSQFTLTSRGPGGICFSGNRLEVSLN